MTTITPDAFVREVNPALEDAPPNLTLWISEAGGLGRFGAFVEGDTETVLKSGDAATFRCGVPIGHCL